MMDGVLAATIANEGVEFVNTVKSTRAIIRFAKDRVEALSPDDRNILHGPLCKAAEMFEYAASCGHDLDSYAAEVHKWFLAIDELAEKT